MLTLITGAPGASKTSHAIDKLFDEKTRPVFFYNIALNEEGRTKLGWMEYTSDQVLDWQNELPPNAILIVDEAQRVWPVRSPSKPVPASCTAMETHRHQGVDLILITQHPGLIDSHIRKLVNEHYHYSRPYGMPFAIQYHSGSGVVSPDNKSELSTCTQSKKPLPKRVWPLYKSAEVHTHKPKIPKALYLVVFAALAAAFLIWKFLQGFGPQTEGDINQVQTSNGGYAQVEQQPDLKHMSWPELLTPEVPGLPYTAPIYRDIAMKPTDVPRIAGCVAYGNLCRCYTQQGTRVSGIDPKRCQQHLKTPSFDHLRPNRENQQSNEQFRLTMRDSAQAHSEARGSAVLIRANTTL